MPLYEFCCTKCKKILERELPIRSELDYIICPSCNRIAHRIISLSSFRLKGSGWSNDNYQGEKQ